MRNYPTMRDVGMLLSFDIVCFICPYASREKCGNSGDGASFLNVTFVFESDLCKGQKTIPMPWRERNRPGGSYNSTGEIGQKL